MKMIAAFLSDSIGFGVLKYTPKHVTLLVFGAIVLLAVAVFLAFTVYYHYIHWMYSHIPQPKRPRYMWLQAIPPACSKINNSDICMHATLLWF